MHIQILLGGISLTVWTVINFAIPIAFMVGLGFYLDHVTKPEVPTEESQE